MFGDLVFWHQGVLAIAAALLLAAAYMDVRSYRIPNAVNLTLLALFPAYVITSPQSVAWPQNVIVFAIVLAVGFLMYAKKWIGAGDIKLLAIVSLWAGVEFVMLFLFITALAGGLLAALMMGLAYVRHLRSKSQEIFSTGKMPIPYGVAIATGGLCMLLVLFNPALLSLRS